MEAKLFHSLTTKPPLPIVLSLPKPSAAAAATRRLIFSPTTTRRLPPLQLRPINSSRSGSGSGSTNESDAAPQPQITPPPETVEVRFRRRSKRRSRQQRDWDGDGDGDGQFAKAAAAASAPPAKKKKWEDMSVAEKAVELYVGERGALYWLNKFAYASIFVVIGVWILFRFVGPSLNLYQLDSPPLAPDSLFKGPS